MTAFTIWFALAASAVTFLAFGWDKRRARKGARRVPERVLLGLAWAGGCVGGWVGMSVFRHKTQKTSFKVKMVLVTLLNLLWGLVYLAVTQTS